MRSNMRDALLVSRLGTAPRRRSLDLAWAALTPSEQVRLEREVDVMCRYGVRAVLAGRVGPLFYTGPYEAMGPAVLAVCGPREAGPPAVRLAELAARRAVAAGATVIAGDNEGPEMAAATAAIAAGGLAVSVLAEGFGPAAPAQRGRPAGADRRVMVSPCAPGQPWSVDAVMARNAALAELCTALVAVEATSTGATLDAGMRALAAGRPVLAIGATAGSRLLVDYGATAACDELEVAWWLHTRMPDTGAAASAARPDRARRCGEGSRPRVGSRPEGGACWPPRSVRRWSTA